MGACESEEANGNPVHSVVLQTPYAKPMPPSAVSLRGLLQWPSRLREEEPHTGAEGKPACLHVHTSSCTLQKKNTEQATQLVTESSYPGEC